MNQRFMSIPRFGRALPALFHYFRRYRLHSGLDVSVGNSAGKASPGLSEALRVPGDIGPRVVALAESPEDVLDAIFSGCQAAFAHLIPFQRRGDRRTGPRAHRVRRDRSLAVGIAQVVEKDTIAAFVLALLDGHQVRMSVGQVATEPMTEFPDLVEIRLAVQRQ